MKKKAGIWLDSREAFIVELIAEEAVVTRVPSDIENFNVVGGSRSSTPWGPQEEVSERKYLERRKHQEQQYFSALWNTLKEMDEIYIFGPAEAKIGLEKAIREHTALKPKLLAVETADSMTEKQLIAQVRQFFAKHP